MAEASAPTTAPKPFVFVLMPFRGEFDDIYKFGIKGAATEVGAYAERVDEQNFAGGMIDRIYNQISKADVIVADMTAQNPNVFYEVGYAHALNKVVVLLTQKAEDIPFDLRHHQHIVYEGKIDRLREALTQKLRWAVAESKKLRSGGSSVRLAVSMLGQEIPERAAQRPPPTLVMPPAWTVVRVGFTIRNTGDAPLPPLSHVYLLSRLQSRLVFGVVTEKNFGTQQFSQTYDALTAFDPLEVDPSDRSQGYERSYRLPGTGGTIPPQAAERIDFGFELDEVSGAVEPVRLRIHVDRGVLEYDFLLSYNKKVNPPDSVGSNA